MIHESIVLLFDEVTEHVALRTSRRGQSPRWQITTTNVPRGFTCTVEIDGEVFASAFGHTVASAHRRALDAFRGSASQTPEELEAALEVSVEVAQRGGFGR